MSLYPKVPTTTKYADLHNTNMDRLLNTRGVTPEDMARNTYSGAASKDYRKKSMAIWRDVAYNYIKVLDKTVTNHADVEDKISFAIALDAVKNILSVRVERDKEYYNDKSVADKLTLELAEEKVKKLKKSRQWLPRPDA